MEYMVVNTRFNSLTTQGVYLFVFLSHMVAATIASVRVPTSLV